MPVSIKTLMVTSGEPDRTVNLSRAFDELRLVPALRYPV